MKHVLTPDPAIHEFRCGERASIFVSFLCCTLGFLTLFLLVNGAGKEIAGGYVLVAALLLVGGFFALLRSGFDFDIRERRYRRWCRCLVPLWVKTGSLDEFESVVLTREVRRGEKSAFPAFLVRLEGLRKLNFSVAPTYEEARRHAEDLARTLDLTLLDKTGGRTLVRDCGSHEEPLWERVRREGSPIAAPGDPPANMRTRVETEGGTLRLRIPARGFRGQLLLALVPLVFFDAALFFIFVLPAVREQVGGKGASMDLIFLGAIGLFMVLIPIIIVLFTILWVSRTSQVVEANPLLLRVEANTPLFKRAVEIPTHTLEGLHVLSAHARAMSPILGPGGPIVARGARRSAMFGGHLPAEEKEWIRDVLEQVLSA